MPGARCTRGLVRKSVQRNAHEHTGSAEAIRPSLRNGFTAYAVLSPATNSSCHRHRRIEGCRTRSGSQNLRRLDTSNGCRNHTTSPYAATSFVCALLIAHGSGSIQNPPCHPVSRLMLPRPPHPIPTFGDDGQRPFLGDRMAGVLKVICPTAKAKICPSGYFVAARHVGSGR